MEDKKLQQYKDLQQSLELPLDIVQKLVCRQLLQPISGQTSNLILNHFNPKFYSNQDLKILYTMISNCWKVYGKSLSINAFKKILSNDKFKDRSQKLTKLMDEIMNINLADYDTKFLQDTLLNYIKAKTVFTTILDNIDYIQTHNDVSLIMPKLEDTMKITLQDDIGIEYFENINNHIKELQDTTTRIPFQWKQWDKFTYGGIPEKDGCLFVIMAQPGLGKSQMMMNIGYQWLLQNKNVLMISLQMSQKMYSSRMSALFSDICVNELKDNIDILKKKIDTFKAFHKGKLYIKQYSPNEFNSNKLKNLLQKLRNNKNFIPDLIIVDYINIMATNGPSYGMKSYQRIGYITKELRALSIESKIPILSATQTSRNSNGYATEDVSMSNTSESSCINMDADCLFALYQMDGDREAGRMNVKILKNRFGGFVDSTFPMMVDYLTLKISDWNDINDQEEDNILPESIEDKLAKANDEQQVDTVLSNL